VTVLFLLATPPNANLYHRYRINGPQFNMRAANSG
jgi:hypothetical protein